MPEMAPTLLRVTAAVSTKRWSSPRSALKVRGAACPCHPCTLNDLCLLRTALSFPRAPTPASQYDHAHTLSSRFGTCVQMPSRGGGSSSDPPPGAGTDVPMPDEHSDPSDSELGDEEGDEQLLNAAGDDPHHPN